MRIYQKKSQFWVGFSAEKKEEAQSMDTMDSTFFIRNLTMMAASQSKRFCLLLTSSRSSWPKILSKIKDGITWIPASTLSKQVSNPFYSEKNFGQSIKLISLILSTFDEASYFAEDRKKAIEKIESKLDLIELIVLGFKNIEAIPQVKFTHD